MSAPQVPPWLWDPRVQQWVPNPQYRPPSSKKPLVIVLGVVAAAVVLIGGALVFFWTIMHDCPTDMMWSDTEGRCVSAWIEPPPPPPSTASTSTAARSVSTERPGWLPPSP